MYGMNLTAAAIDTVIAAAGFSGLVLCCGEFKKRKKHAGRKSAARLLMKHTALAKAELKKIKSIKSVFNAGKVRKEIAEGIAIMRNRIASCDGERLTTDVMLEELFLEADILRYPYSRMLSLIRTEERGRAIEEFTELTGNKDSKEYARMIVMLDELHPRDVYASAVSFQKTLTEEKITDLRKRDETISDLLYLPVVANLLLIFFNFLYVAYFMNQGEMAAFFG